MSINGMGTEIKVIHKAYGLYLSSSQVIYLEFIWLEQKKITWQEFLRRTAEARRDLRKRDLGYLLRFLR